MKKSILLIALFSGILTFAKAPQWDKTGHRSTAAIATTYMSKKAKKEVSKLLDGASPALVATFGDDIKSNPKYDKYKPWHYLDIPKGKTYEEIKGDLGPNIISAIQKCENGLRDKNTPRKKKQFYLKMLIHLIGDLHQPLHIGHPKDLGGNKIAVYWFGKSSNLHKVWDSEMINS